MGDFHQNGAVATLHNLCDRPIAEMGGRGSWALQKPGLWG